eukprot:7376398-Prymnesium_polylepis.1
MAESGTLSGGVRDFINCDCRHLIGDGRVDRDAVVDVKRAAAAAPLGAVCVPAWHGLLPRPRLEMSLAQRTLVCFINFVSLDLVDEIGILASQHRELRQAAGGEFLGRLAPLPPVPLIGVRLRGELLLALGLLLELVVGVLDGVLLDGGDVLLVLLLLLCAYACGRALLLAALPPRRCLRLALALVGRVELVRGLLRLRVRLHRRLGARLLGLS